MSALQLSNVSPLIEASEIWAQHPDRPLWLAYDGAGHVRLASEAPARLFARIEKVKALDESAVVDVPTVHLEWPSGRNRLILPAAWDDLAPYEGRPYELRRFDCYTLVRDWMKRERGIDMGFLTEDPRRMSAWTTEGAFIDNPEMAKWERVVIPARGDGILFAMDRSGSGAASHCGVYLGDGTFLHHFFGRASVVEPMDDFWRSRVTAYMRHVDG